MIFNDLLMAYLVEACILNYRMYTRVNKRIRLFPKLHGYMHLLPKMRVIMKAKLTTPQNCNAFLVTLVHDVQKSRVVEIVDIVPLYFASDEATG